MIAFFRGSRVFPLLSLVIFHLLLVSVQVRNEHGQSLLRTGSLLLVTPPAMLISFMVEQVKGAAEGYALLFGAQRENERLRLENARLKLQLEQFRGLRTMLERTRSVELLASSYTFETRMAGIIWKSAPFFSDQIVAGIGSSQGIRRDAAVLTAEGVVGRVISVTPFSAEIELLSNTNAAAGALLPETRLQGVIQGEGNEVLRLNFIPGHAQVAVGETVYTSGTDRIYPKGLPIGEVVESRAGLMYREIWVRPFADYSRIEEVLIVVSD